MERQHVTVDEALSVIGEFGWGQVSQFVLVRSTSRINVLTTFGAAFPPCACVPRHLDRARFALAAGQLCVGTGRCPGEARNLDLSCSASASWRWHTAQSAQSARRDALEHFTRARPLHQSLQPSRAVNYRVVNEASRHSSRSLSPCRH